MPRSTLSLSDRVCGDLPLKKYLFYRLSAKIKGAKTGCHDPRFSPVDGRLPGRFRLCGIWLPRRRARTGRIDPGHVPSGYSVARSARLLP